MSNLPPPTFGGPPNPAERPTAAFTPLPPIAPTASKKRRLPLLIAAAIMVIAALVVGAIAVFGGGDGAGNISSGKAGGAVEDSASAARVPRDAPGVVLSDCPFNGLEDLAKKAPPGFDVTAASAGDIQAAVTRTDQRNDPELIQCAIGDDTLRYGVAAAALPPTDIQDFVDRTLTEATGKFTDTARFRGGTLLPFCTRPNAGSGRPVICATAWYDSKLFVALFASGKGASTDLTTTWIKTELSTMVKNLEQSDRNVNVDTTQPADTSNTSGTGDTVGTTPDTTG